MEFSLTAQNETYLGAIEGGRITVHVPENVDLKGAAAVYRLSEGATISPDPLSVSDWSVERQFIVTSKAQASRNYRYVPSITQARQDGSVVLATREEVDSFKEKKITAIEGDLIIGTVRGKKITNLDGLAYLKQVGRSLVINPSYDGEDLSGLLRLEKVGNFRLGSAIDTSRCEKIKEVLLPSLREVSGNFIVNCWAVEKVSIPKVESIKGDACFISNVPNSIDVGSLAEVGGSLVVRGVTKEKIKSKPLVETLNFNSLTRVNGKIEIEYFLNLDGIYFPKLTQVGGTLKINNTVKLGSVDASELTEVGGIDFSSNSNLTQIAFPKLQVCSGPINISGNITDLDISSLIDQNGDITWHGFATKEIKLNPEFNLNGDLMYIGVSNDFGKVIGPSVFNGSVTFYQMKGKEAPVVFEGISKLTGSLKIEECWGQAFTFSFTEIEGTLSLKGISNKLDMKSLEKVGEVSLIDYNGRNPEYILSNLREVERSCYFDLAQSTAFDLRSLERVGGGVYYYAVC